MQDYYQSYYLFQIEPVLSTYMSYAKGFIGILMYFFTITGLPRSLSNANQNHGIDLKCLSIGIDRNWSTLGSMPEFWSALGIGRGSLAINISCHGTREWIYEVKLVASISILLSKWNLVDIILVSLLWRRKCEVEVPPNINNYPGQRSSLTDSYEVSTHTNNALY